MSYIGIDSNIKKITIVIPAFNPDDKLIILVSELFEVGFSNIIVVNDGSNSECEIIFDKIEEMGVNVIVHYVNLGQGRAFKSAFNYYMGGVLQENSKFSSSLGIVECDADGQHLAKDILKCAKLLLEHQNCFILGVRNFDKTIVPFRSRFGNRVTSFIFKYCCGIDVKDTQTGLKGIPNCLIKDLIQTTGERFEYATSVLLDVNKKGIPIIQYDIETVYIENNSSSHFNPVIDSVRIYSVLFKYIIASSITIAADYLIFSLFLMFYNSNVYYANAIAKVFAGVINFFINKQKVFKSDGNVVLEVAKYIFLCTMHVFVSSALINVFYSIFNISKIIIKAFVDTALFVIVFYVQRAWVFAKKDNNRYEKRNGLE